MSSSKGQTDDPALPATVGRYEIVRLLGEGAMGRVLLARDPVLERDVAVKHLREDLKIPRDVRQGLLVRMRHEARAAARVAHPNLVVVHDMGEDAAVGLYLVFEYVEGPTLKERIAEGRLPAVEVARLAGDLGAALTVAHEAGVLHRDIKPENVILARWGGKIADFGIARIPDSTLTHQGGLMGTPAYSAPETFRAGTFSPASDQFSLAASLYEALSGRRAFPGEDAVAVAAKIASDLPEPFARSLGLPAAVDEVLGRGLARKPEDRFETCAAFGTALADSLGQVGRRTLSSASGILSYSDSPTKPGRGRPIVEVARPGEMPRERRIGQVLVGAIVVVGTAALLGRAALRSSESEANPAVESSAVPSAAASTPSAHPRPSASAVPHHHPRVEASAAPSAPEPRSSASARPPASAAELRPDAGPATPAAPADAGDPPAKADH